MKRQLYYNLDSASLVDAGGSIGLTTPELAYGDSPAWEINLVSGVNAPVDVSDATVWRAGVDVDLKSSTSVLIRMLPEKIDITGAAAGKIVVTPAATTEEFFAAVDGKSGVTGIFELYGMSATNRRLYRVRFGLSLTAAVDADGSGAVPVENPAYLTRDETLAAIAQELVYEYSVDGTSWHEAFAAGVDRWQRVRHGADGTPSEAQAIPYGADGKSILPDGIGLLEFRPATPAAGYCYVGTDTGLVYWYIGDVWSAGVPIAAIPGIDGNDGRGITSIIKTATAGLVDTYTITFTDGTTTTYQVRNGDVGGKGDKGNPGDPGDKGDPGDGLAIDMTGPLTQRHLYDGAARGFRFLATDLLTDEDSLLKYQHFYQKTSDEFGAWSAGIRLYCGRQGDKGDPGNQGAIGPRGENADVVPDLVFASSDIFGGSLVIDGVRPIAQVELVINDDLDTVVIRDNGTPGIPFIRVCRAEGHTILYFGTMDVSRGGRVRFAQGLQALSPYQIWLANGNTGDEAAFLSWLQGAAVRFLVTSADLNGDGTLTLETLNPPVAIIDPERVQWQLPQTSVTYTETTVTIDMPRVLAMAGVAAMTGTWQVLTSGGGKGEKGDIGPRGLNGSPTVYTGATPPENPIAGMLWMV